MIQSDRIFQTGRSWRSWIALLVLGGVIIMTGCATVSGIGQDIQSAGHGLEKTSDRVSEEISGR